MSTVTISDTPFVGNDRLLVGIVLSVLTFWLFAQSVINVVPAMKSSLDISLETLTLAVSLSALFSGCFVVASGGLADKFGRMRMTTLGLGLSIVGSAMLVVAQGPGLQKISADLAAPILKRFKISNELYDRVMLIIPIHDIHIGTKKKNIKKWLNRLGEQGLRDLIAVKRADKLGQNPKMTGEELQNLVTTESLVDEIIANAEPYSVKDLKINGFDLINLGFKGKEIGDILSTVLEMVIDGKIENEKDILLKYAKEKGELN